jgi:hypothetical protein
VNFYPDCPIVKNGAFTATVFQGEPNVYVPASGAAFETFRSRFISNWQREEEGSNM